MKTGGREVRHHKAMTAGNVCYDSQYGWRVTESYNMTHSQLLLWGASARRVIQPRQGVGPGGERAADPRATDDLVMYSAA